MFDRLPTVPRSQELIDRAFRRGSRAVKQSGDQDMMVTTSAQILADALDKIVHSFPSFENLPPFYFDLVEALVGVDRMRLSLSRIGWATKQIRTISREHRARLKAGGAPSPRGGQGRMASVLKSIDKDLVFLSEARDKLRSLPTVDPELPTVVIAGYPNVGKSSFLIQVTGARPEVASYPFTTQGIVLGHLNRGHQRYQVVDTPGLLDRPLAERNRIEQQAVAALRHLKGVVLFILDPSEHAGYPLQDQLQLLEEIRNWMELPVVVAANKSDLGDYPHADLSMSTLTGNGVAKVLEVLLDKLDNLTSSDAGQLA
ncbi:MAG: NOG1 family protein [Methanosarcinales archaeon]|nr:NOG1 family protein [Methanosarcinales archaeon]